MRTDKQASYLKRLLIEAFAHRYATIYDYNHLGNVTREDASAEIERLKSAKSRGWLRGEKPAPLTTGPWDHLDNATRTRYCEYRKTEPMAHVRAFQKVFSDANG